MSDWQVGDLAVCVDARPNPVVMSAGGLVDGRTYEVAGIVPSLGHGRDNSFYPTCCGLLLVGMRSGSYTGAYAEPRFRKIRPDEQEPCETEFVTLLKRSKQRVVA